MEQIVYVSSPNSQQIHVWNLDNKRGILRLMQIIFTPGRVQPLIVDSEKKYLYAGIRPDFGIVVYHIDKFGLLKYYKLIKIFNSPTHLMIDNKNKFLFCSSYQSNSLTIIPINDKDCLNRSIQIIENLLGCHSSYIDNINKLLFIPCLKANSIQLFKICISERLIFWHTNTINMTIHSGPRHMVILSDVKYYYVINELNSTVSVIQYDSLTNKIFIKQNINIIPKNLVKKKFWASDLHITPNKKFLYCSDRSISILSCFEICQETKLLRFLNYSLTELQPRGFSIDKTGKYLISSGQKSHHISMYLIDSNSGKLIFLSRYKVGLGPMWVTIIQK